MDRVSRLRAKVDEMLHEKCNPDYYLYGYGHLFGVADACVVLALKRGLDVELAAMAGMLHDLHTYVTGDHVEHAKHGAVLAREILGELEIVNVEESDLICGAIAHHSDKLLVHGEFAELLKDADVWQHTVSNLGETIATKEDARWAALQKEFGI